MKTKPTKDFFKGKKYYYRDSDIDSWLPKKQEVVDKLYFKVMPFDKMVTFKEAFGENPNTFSLDEIEKLIDKTDNGENIGLRTDGFNNLFPVKSKDGVAVVRVDRDERQWRVSVDRLDNDYRWDVEGRFFSRNGFDTSTLSTSDTSLEKAIEIVKGAGYEVFKRI